MSDNRNERSREARAESAVEEEPLLIRGVRVDPIADLALPLLLVLHAALTVGIASALLDGLAGRPFLPGLGWWALFFAMESWLFTGLFFVREVDLPGALRGVEVVLMLVLAKYLSTAPLMGWGLGALSEIEALEPWVGVLALAWAWYMGMRAATLSGALHPALQPDPTLETIRQDDAGEAFQRVRSQLLSTTGGIALLSGAMPALAGEGWVGEAAGIWIMPGLVTAAALAAGALFAGARLRQQINWQMERLQPPAGVLSRWAPQAIALILVPLLLAIFLPAGPHLPVERLFGREPVKVEGQPLPFVGQPGENTEFDIARALHQLAGESIEFPAWLPALVRFLMILGGTLLAGIILQVAYRELADRLGWTDKRGLIRLLRGLLRLYGALWQAFWEGTRGAAAMAAQGTAEAAGALFGQAGLLGRYLPTFGSPPTEPRAAVRFYFARLQTEAARRGLRRATGMTASEYAARLAKAAPEQRGEIAQLTGAYNQARYSPDEPSPGQVSVARQAALLIARALGRR